MIPSKLRLCNADCSFQACQPFPFLEKRKFFRVGGVGSGESEKAGLEGFEDEAGGDGLAGAQVAGVRRAGQQQGAGFAPEVADGGDAGAVVAGGADFDAEGGLAVLDRKRVV